MTNNTKIKYLNNPTPAVSIPQLECSRIVYMISGMNNNKIRKSKKLKTITKIRAGRNVSACAVYTAHAQLNPNLKQNITKGSVYSELHKR